MSKSLFFLVLFLFILVVSQGCFAEEEEEVEDEAAEDSQEEDSQEDNQEEDIQEEESQEEDIQEEDDQEVSQEDNSGEDVEGGAEEGDEGGDATAVPSKLPPNLTYLPPGCNVTYCLRNPCYPNPCKGQCYSDYCNGCTARCICTSSLQCKSTEWCRVSAIKKPGTNLKYSFCTPYQTEGQSCGGFTLVQYQRRCGPGLVCTDYPQNVADAPGYCRRRCITKCINPTQYCSHSNKAASPYGICRQKGTCYASSDCSNPYNKYFTLPCVGVTYCANRYCKKKCTIVIKKSLPIHVPIPPHFTTATSI